ncbi:glycosyltransferase family 4 protein [Bacteroides sp. UBA939]|uniref:glycosyltransferase family 4 protein n=1 Tax=Bacteroides sp. UBA939 TaxID=1946092 RepID=UPI0025B7BC80|nr:glycosyltransferase family 4 protein [Bacteroides sp. UBA939]
MNKIAFVVVRYGEGINGGAEYHCKMLAERLVCNYQVEVLTTCVKNYKTGGNEYPEGEEYINGVLVRRFKVEPVNEEMKLSFVKKARKAFKLRKALYKVRLLAPLSTLFPVWTYRQKWEIDMHKSSVFYSPSLFSFIKEHKADYKVFIPFTIDYPLAYYTAQYAPEKTIIIPTLHYHQAAFRSIQTHIFTKVAYIGFNTRAEEKLAQRTFGPFMSPHGIISVGYELTPPADWNTTSSKYQLPPEYLLYVGRVASNKLHDIFDYFITYKERYKDSQLKFVVVGGLFCETYQHPDIIYTGFVDEAEKTAIIEHAKIVINPSRFESLSLILLEAMSLKKAMLVNGRCNVLKEHCKKSKYAALPYSNRQEFMKQLHRVDSSEELRTEMGEKGFNYIRENYNWDLIMQRLTNCIERISAQNV